LRHNIRDGCKTEAVHLQAEDILADQCVAKLAPVQVVTAARSAVHQKHRGRRRLVLPEPHQQLRTTGERIAVTSRARQNTPQLRGAPVPAALLRRSCQIPSPGVIILRIGSLKDENVGENQSVHARSLDEVLGWLNVVVSARMLLCLFIHPSDQTPTSSLVSSSAPSEVYRRRTLRTVRPAELPGTGVSTMAASTSRVRSAPPWRPRCPNGRRGAVLSVGRRGVFVS
jgi:hypothetical protein